MFRAYEKRGVAGTSVQGLESQEGACESLRGLARWNKTALGPQRQTETSLKIEDLRFNKTTGKLS
jgi:hypothetical protein